MDEIEDSLNKRVSEGNSVTHQVRCNENSMEGVFMLKQIGDMPKLVQWWVKSYQNMFNSKYKYKNKQ